MTKRIIRWGVGAVLASVLLVVLVAGAAFASGDSSMGPAPNSGDCVPDGSGFDAPMGPATLDAVGPAPNAGDGIPDGSGF